ncbi:hypothetical protein ACJMK2_009608 [Sinanodonta woodiana]|uniref:Uncharacterized protein n=1 Tax=Sinanodonta woodiana TaxID=1069815 RepID=A0ABD3VCQ8_SINWO
MMAGVSCLLFLLLTVGLNGNHFDPHLFPKTGPFFEGWYMRITDFDRRDSLGILFGQVLPKQGINTSEPLVLASILRRENCQNRVCQLVSYNAIFTPAQTKVTVNGKPVVSNPDDASSANFQFEMNSGSEGGLFIQNANSTTFYFRIGNLSLKGELGPNVPWAPNGGGPEGWLSHLPLPLHWFVYSLRSPLKMYILTDIGRKQTVVGHNGVAHLEKNWGLSFPKAWIWAEGVSDYTKNISFALSGGLVPFSFISLSAYLIGYRNPLENIDINFRPDNSVITLLKDDCKREVNISAKSLFYTLEINLFSTNSSFSSCLFGPQETGFRKACVESYDAIANIRVYKSSILGVFVHKLIDKQTLTDVALEFGGTYVCGNMCMT